MSDNIWSRVSQQLRAQLSAQDYDTWIAPLSFAIEGNQAQLIVPHLFFESWLRENYWDLLQNAFSSAGAQHYSITFVYDNSPPLKPQTPSFAAQPLPDFSQTAPAASPPAQLKSEAQSAALSKARAYFSGSPPAILTPRYSFDTFIVGHCNQLAHAACMAAASQPGRQYNPLFVFGGPGLGKTHLLSAVGNFILKQNPAAQVYYCSAEAFANELIQAVRFDGVRLFQEKYRQLDCLLLDDIQFMAGRERTQEEFFHTFNALYNSGKQIVVAGDKLPRDIDGLEQRLRTRFEWGLLVDLQPPDEETTVSILQKKAAERGLDLSGGVALYLARQPERNIRVLEGYLSRIIAVSHFQGVEVTVDLVSRVVGPLISTRPVNLEEVIQLVASYYKVPLEDLKSSRKNREISHPRQVAMYLTRRLTKASYPEIGKSLGNKDHSTVVKGVQKIENLLRTNPEIVDQIRSVEKYLQEHTRQKKIR